MRVRGTNQYSRKVGRKGGEKERKREASERASEREIGGAVSRAPVTMTTAAAALSGCNSRLDQLFT